MVSSRCSPSTLLIRITHHLSHGKTVSISASTYGLPAQCRQEDSFINLYIPWSNKHGPWLSVCCMNEWMVIWLLLWLFNMPQGGHDLIWRLFSSPLKSSLSSWDFVFLTMWKYCFKLKKKFLWHKISENKREWYIIFLVKINTWLSTRCYR